MAESTGQPGPPRPEDLPSADVADAKLVAHRLEEATKDVEVQRRWYWTNLSFVMGEQWVWWDRDRNVVDYVPQTYSPLGRGRTRLTVNRMKPNYVTLLARLTKRALTFESAATGADDATLMAAHLADAVLAHLHREQSWEEQRVNELMAAILGSTSAVSVEWDGRAGRTLEIDPTTNKFVGTGEARLESLSINNFALERGVRSVEEARYWIRDVGLPPPTVKDHYKLDWTPQPDVGPKMSALQHRLLQDSGRESGRTLTRVITMYERPHGGSKGQIVTVVNNVVVDRRPWIFPFNHLNLVTFRQLPLDERWTGDTFMNDAIRIQAAYNFARSATSENMKLVGNPRLMYQHGQIHASQLRGDSPGDSLVYTAGFDGGKPDYLRP
ncbi:MAG: hypothetical protein GY795_11440, partial [Desulfobacterales bacterium]|nr:hypothetical protein [Desulfobacterales bacterium]